jgi:hypothetical protein
MFKRELPFTVEMVSGPNCFLSKRAVVRSHSGHGFSRALVVAPPCAPTEFRFAPCDLACCRFLRLFELGVGFDPGAASQAFLRPHLARGATIYRAGIYPGRHSSRYKGHRSAGTIAFVTATWSSFMSPSAEFLKYDNVSLSKMLSIKGTGFRRVRLAY